MFDPFYKIVDYFFPVYIVRREDILSIEDRRPTGELLLCGSGAILLVAIAVLIFTSVADTIWFVIISIAIAIFLAYRAMRQSFREIYVFDKAKDTYWFVRQSVLKKEVIEGSASQFRAAQVITKSVSTDNGTDYIYQAALLQQPGLLLGTDETQVLREYPPIFNSFDTEQRIVQAISSFLSVKKNDLVDSL